MPRGTKRKRRHDEDATDSESPPNGPQSPIESIDLTEVEGSSALAKALAKQREDAVKAQSTEEGDKARSMLKAYQCPVCMDTLEDATSTSCGQGNLPGVQKDNHPERVKWTSEKSHTLEAQGDD
ncbi:hypothetical protein PENSUB_4020 [Penicillium subrubescens]|uniref:Uncharacterized protein n=1 Tax=Penicillium subrubescens TaxID=1316194 RepID=A0A1Q5UE24_9EURO|nr:hypothetical protein PENSUB_4020 [Penicillium subrubescens]